jgi:hypothetical protein
MSRDHAFLLFSIGWKEGWKASHLPILKSRFMHQISSSLFIPDPDRSNRTSNSTETEENGIFYNQLPRDIGRAQFLISKVQAFV